MVQKAVFGCGALFLPRTWNLTGRPEDHCSLHHKHVLGSIATSVAGRLLEIGFTNIAVCAFCLFAVVFFEKQQKGDSQKKRHVLGQERILECKCAK